MLSSRSADVTRHLQKEREEEKEEEEEGDSPKNEMCHLGTHYCPRLHTLNYSYAGMHVCTSDCKLAPAAPYRLGKMHPTYFIQRGQGEEKEFIVHPLWQIYIFPQKKGERGASAAKRKAGTKESSSISAIPSRGPPRSAEQSKQIPEGGNPFFREMMPPFPNWRRGTWLHPSFPPSADLRFHSHFLTTTFYSSSSFFSPFFLLLFPASSTTSTPAHKKLGERAEEILRREGVA